ncbi:hypothetical protein ABEF95_001573 [Exophiala dermatitidis]
MATSAAQQTMLPLAFGIEIEFLFGIDNAKAAANPAYEDILRNNIILDNDQVDEIYDTEFDDAYDRNAEGLFQAASALRRKGANLRIRFASKSGGLEDFSRWILTQEEAVEFPMSSAELSAYTNGEFRRCENCAFAGLELISPILKVPDVRDGSLNGLVEVNEFLGHMRGRQDVPCFFSAEPKNASIHVHIGLPPTAGGKAVDLPLNLLRHLAFICIAFEDVISLLHHPERLGFPDTKIELYAKPNRVFLGRNPVTSPLHNCREGPEFSAQDEFVKIFNYDHGSDRMDRARLCGILCSRTGYDISRSIFVNFSNIMPPPSPAPHSKKTVEFRQHHGTLSVEEVNQWVFFVTALVRAAERKMNQESVEVPLPYDFIPKVIEKQGDYSKQILTFQQAWKYPEILWNKKRSLKELFDLLDMPLERRMWWWQKASYFRSNPFKEYRYLSTCAAPCDNLPRRDCDGWDGEGIPRPY